MPSSLLQSDGGAFIHMIMVGTYTRHSCGGLRLVKIQNKINAQRILWAVKLWNMKDGCFTKQVANSLIGVNDGEYFGLDILKADKTNMTFHTKDNFIQN